ncbi:DUF4179 domain-containing protein [Paenibacillus gansuensis]|uniref:DUF4179 domain-containing protein n=1 Tax=Paenibacillus gansuensis TaxID=306542 RepID=A0ABW5PHX2_9BACL
MNLENLIREAKPDYIRGDKEQAALSVLARIPQQSTRHIRRSKVRLVAVIIASALMIGVGVLTSGYVSPTMATALNRLPFVGNLFEQSGDNGLRNASKQGLISSVNASQTKKGITFSISEVMYDTTRISMVLTRGTSDGKVVPIDKWLGPTTEETIQRWKQDQIDYNHLEFWVNGERLHVNTGMFSDISQHNATIMTIRPDPTQGENTFSSLPDEFQLQLRIRDATIDADFVLDFPVKKTVHVQLDIRPSEVKRYEDMRMEVTHLVMTNASMLLDVTLTGSPERIEELGNTLKYDITNEKGEESLLRGASSSWGLGNNTYKNVVEMTPFAALPKLVVIKPYVVKEGMEKVYIPELEFVLEVPGKGE